MKKYRIFSLLITFSLLLTLTAPFACASNSALVDSMSVEAGHALLYNNTTDEIYYEQNARDKAYPASITKVMTALLTLEAVDRGEITLDQAVTVSDTAMEGLASDGSTMGLKVGETLTVEQLLYCLLLPSANEAANILAEAVSGSVSDFVALMNTRAQELGCEGTHFVNACGLHDDDHYTTAYDICLFFKEALTHETFRQIIGTDQYILPATNLAEERTLYNTNGLLTPLHYSGYTYSPCIGGKTGSTSQAGYCLVSAAEKDGTTLIAVVLNATLRTNADNSVTRMQFYESKRLLQWGFDSFSVRTILEPGSPMAEIAVTLSEDCDYVTLTPADSISLTLPNDVDTSKITPQLTLHAESVEAPVTKGQVLGTVTMVDEEGNTYGSTDLIATADVQRSEFLYRIAVIRDILSKTWVKVLIVVILILIVLLVLRLTLFRRSRRYGGGRRSYSGGGYRGSRRRRR